MKSICLVLLGLFLLSFAESSYETGLVRAAITPQNIPLVYLNFSLPPSAPSNGSYGYSSPIDFWYSLERSFMGVVQPNGLNVDFAAEVSYYIQTGKVEASTILPFFGRTETIGVVILFCVGILYVIVILFGGLIFCCCRCCCNEGYQKYDENGAKGTRLILSLLLVCFGALIALGTATLYLSLKDLDTSIRDAPRFVNSTFDSVDGLLEHTVSEITFLPRSGLETISHAILSDLDIAPNLIADQVYRALEHKNATDKLEEVKALGPRLCGTQPSEGPHHLRFGVELMDHFVGSLASRMLMERDGSASSKSQWKLVLGSVQQFIRNLKPPYSDRYLTTSWKSLLRGVADAYHALCGILLRTHRVEGFSRLFHTEDPQNATTVSLKTVRKSPFSIFASFTENSILHSQIRFVDNTIVRMRSFSEMLTVLRNDANGIAVALQEPARILREFCGAHGSQCFTSGIDPSKLTLAINVNPAFNENDMLRQLQIISDKNLTAMGESASAEFRSIPARIKNQTENVRKELQKSLGNFQVEIRKYLVRVEKEVAKFRDELRSTETQVLPITHEMLKYNHYMMYGAAGLAAFYGVLLGLLFLGLCGLCSYRTRDLPTERRCAVRSSGCSLMLVVYLTLLTSWLFMIPTTILFLVTSQTNAAVCPILLDQASNFSQLEKILVNWNLPIQLPGNVSLPTALSRCYADSTFYTAFSLSSIFDLDRFQEELDKLNIANEIQGLTENLPEIQVLEPTTEEQINDLLTQLRTASFEGFTAANSSIPAVEPSLTAVASNLEKLTSSGAISVSDEVRDLPRRLREIHNERVTPLANKRPSIERRTKELEKYLQEAAAKADHAYDALQSVEVLIQENIAQPAGALPIAIKQYAARQEFYGQQFVNFAISAIRNDVGKCGGLARTFDEVSQITCKSLLGPLNGVWFAWGLILMSLLPSIMLSTRLARYYTRANYTDVEKHSEITFQYPMQPLNRKA